MFKRLLKNYCFFASPHPLASPLPPPLSSPFSSFFFFIICLAWTSQLWGIAFMEKNSKSCKNNVEEVRRRKCQERWFALTKWGRVLERTIQSYYNLSSRCYLHRTKKTFITQKLMSIMELFCWNNLQNIYINDNLNFRNGKEYRDVYL